MLKFYFSLSRFAHIFTYIFKLSQSILFQLLLLLWLLPYREIAVCRFIYITNIILKELRERERQSQAWCLCVFVVKIFIYFVVIQFFLWEAVSLLFFKIELGMERKMRRKTTTSSAAENITTTWGFWQCQWLLDLMENEKLSLEMILRKRSRTVARSLSPFLLLCID